MKNACFRFRSRLETVIAAEGYFYPYPKDDVIQFIKLDIFKIIPCIYLTIRNRQFNNHTLQIYSYVFVA